MPVYLATVHSYQSWREDHPRGYVQHGEGWKPTNKPLARWRAAHADQPPTRFASEDQAGLHVVAREISDELQLRLHACATTLAHVHQVVSFRSPACQCGAQTKHCPGACPAYRHVEAFLTRYKRFGGFRLAKLNAVKGRIWFSRGWEITPVRARDHFEHLVSTYLPKHRAEAGIVEIYP